MTSSCHHFQISTTYVFQKRFTRKKRRHALFGYDSLNKIKRVELYYMKHVYMHMKYHGRGHGTSVILKVIVKIYGVG